MHTYESRQYFVFSTKRGFPQGKTFESSIVMIILYQQKYIDLQKNIGIYYICMMRGTCQENENE